MAEYGRSPSLSEEPAYQRDRNGPVAGLVEALSFAQGPRLGEGDEYGRSTACLRPHAWRHLRSSVDWSPLDFWSAENRQFRPWRISHACHVSRMGDRISHGDDALHGHGCCYSL